MNKVARRGAKQSSQNQNAANSRTRCGPGKSNQRHYGASRQSNMRQRHKEAARKPGEWRYMTVDEISEIVQYVLFKVGEPPIAGVGLEHASAECLETVEDFAKAINRVAPSQSPLRGTPRKAVKNEHKRVREVLLLQRKKWSPQSTDKAGKSKQTNSASCSPVAVNGVTPLPSRSEFSKLDLQQQMMYVLSATSESKQLNRRE